MLLLLVLWHKGHSDTVQKNFMLKQLSSPRQTHHELHFLFFWCLHDVPGLRLWVCNKGETHFPNSDFSELDPQAPLIPVFCFGRVLMGIATSPKWRLRQRVVQHIAWLRSPAFCFIFLPAAAPVFYPADQHLGGWQCRILLQNYSFSS